MICQGVQNPHCSASASTNARCSACIRPSFSRPSMVVTSCPAQSTASLRQAYSARPSTITVHAPQSPMSHDFLVPVRPRSKRSASTSVRRGSTLSGRSTPFTRRTRSVASMGLLQEASAEPGTPLAMPQSGDPLKIAQIAPLAESVPPQLYGGTERVVSYLTEELVRLGHEVTLFASGDSRTGARLVPCSRRALRLDPAVKDPLAHVVLMLEKVRQRAHEFDVLHFHADHLHLPLFRPCARKTVTTLRGRLDLPDLAPLYAEFHDMPLVSISASQRRPLARAGWIGTVHHGLASSVCPFNGSPRGGYLAFLGRV